MIHCLRLSLSIFFFFFCSFSSLVLISASVDYDGRNNNNWRGRIVRGGVIKCEDETKKQGVITQGNNGYRRIMGRRTHILDTRTDHTRCTAASQQRIRTKVHPIMTFIGPLLKSTTSAGAAARTKPTRDIRPKIITTTTTTLNLKFKTFDEMLIHHNDTPILIDFYAPWCGPCRMMKAELSSIKSRLDIFFGPSPQIVAEDEEEEDCSVEDYVDLAVSANCIDVVADTTVTEEDTMGKTGSSSKVKTTKQQQKPTTGPSTTTGGIPVYHVNTNKFPQVGAKNKIHGLPTLVLFHEGEEMWRNEGIMLGDDIMDVLTSLLLLQDKEIGEVSREKKKKKIVE